MVYKILQKAGDSFDQICLVPSEWADGYFKEWTLKCQIRVARNNTLIDDLDCTWLDPDLTRVISLKKLDTTTWPVGPAVFDIQLTRKSDNIKLSFDTISVLILRDITQ